MTSIICICCRNQYDYDLMQTLSATGCKSINPVNAYIALDGSIIYVCTICEEDSYERPTN